MAVQTIQGFEFDRRHKFNDSAVYLLGHIKRKKFVQVQIDDGLEQQQAIQQIMTANENQYFDIIPVNEHQYMIAMHDYNKVEL